MEHPNICIYALVYSRVLLILVVNVNDEIYDDDHAVNVDTCGLDLVLVNDRDDDEIFDREFEMTVNGDYRDLNTFS